MIIGNQFFGFKEVQSVKESSIGCLQNTKYKAQNTKYKKKTDWKGGSSCIGGQSFQLSLDVATLPSS